jgi:hypothetical protein
VNLNLTGRLIHLPELLGCAEQALDSLKLSKKYCHINIGHSKIGYERNILHINGLDQGFVMSANDHS